MKILIVDDKKENLYLLERIIKKIGYEGVMAENGEQALEKLHSDNFIMVISDILMPVMDGFQLCQAVRSNEKFNDLLFIFYTATYVEKEDEEFALKLGADKFLRKPLEPVKLIEAIKTLIQNMEISPDKSSKTIIKEEEEIFKLYSERLVNKLEQKMLNLEKEIIKRQHVEQDLKERVKELTCLYNISKLNEQSDISMEQFIFEILKFIPPAWQFPDVACARIIYNGHEFKTENFRETRWRQKGDIKEHEKIVGSVEVCYLKEMPDFNEDLFFKEEKDLINAIAEIFGLFIEHKKYEEQLKKFKFMVQSAHDAIFFKDLESRYIIVNDKTLEVFGLSREEVIGKNDFELMIDKVEAKKNVEDDQEIFKTGKMKHLTKLMARRDGKKYWFHAIKVPLFDDDGKIIGIVGVARDITEQKRVEEKLKESEEKYRGILENIKDLYFEVDLKGNFIFFNSIGLEMLEYSKDELLGLNYSNIMDKETAEEIFNVFNKVFKTNIRRSSEFEIKTKYGKRIIIDTYIDLKYDNTGKKIGFNGLARDITERKKAEVLRERFTEKLENKVKIRTKELNEALERQKLYQEEIIKSSQFKSEFLASMSHELRTPLNSLLGFSQLLLEESYGAGLNETQIDFMNDIKAAGEHLLSLIDSILDLSKIEAGKFELSFHKLNLNDFLKKVNSIVKPLYDRKGLSYIVEGMNNDDWITADPLRLKQIFYNLLSNAIKFTKEGTVKICVIERIDHWEFQIIDTGIGIAKEDYEVVFREFGRIENDKIDDIPGAGLGLALTRRLVQQHGGEIWFESEIGKETTFYFTIPKKKISN